MGGVEMEREILSFTNCSIALAALYMTFPFNFNIFYISTLIVGKITRSMFKVKYFLLFSSRHYFHHNFFPVL